MKKPEREQIKKADLISFREKKETDHPLIYSTWLKGFYYDSRLLLSLKKFGILNQNDFFKAYAPILQMLIIRSSFKVACLKDDEDTILGYSVYEAAGKELLLHWVYVKGPWRRIGLMKDLLPAFTIVTHLNDLGMQLKPKEIPYVPSYI